MSKARTLADAVAAGGAMRLAELATNGTNTVGLSAPNALAADLTFKLPNADGTNGQFLKTDGAGNLAWATGGGGGDVTGPASSTDNAVARFDGTTGKLIQNSNFVVSDSGEVTSGTWNGTPIQSATGGTGQTSYTAGQLLIGNNSGGLTKSTLTAGSNVTITNGNGSITIAAGGGLTWAAVQTTGFTAVAGNAYPCNTTSAAFTVTLPASPAAGNVITLTDYAGTFATNALTINPNGNKINGVTGNSIVATNRGSVNLIYVDATQGWVSSASVSSNIVLPLISFDYAVVAGGGGGGGSQETPGGGGGGAGGMKTGTATGIAIGTVFTVTVGGFGAGGSGQNGGSQGSSSSLAATGFTTVSTTGGGGAGAYSNKAGTTGGSGGGGAGLGTTSTGYAGTSGEGNSGGNGANQAGGGGGGKAAAGGNGNAVTTYVGGVGGAGSEWPASSGTYYAGGGGGGGSAILQSGSYAGGAGGTGGGGAGSASGNTSSVSNGTAGTANTGGGGGGGGGSNGNGGFQTVVGGNGGKGVVIIRYADSYPAASATTGSPTITVSGGYRTYKFTDSGSLTF